MLFIHQMVIWSLEENTTLLKQAHGALKDGEWNGLGTITFKAP